MKKLVYLKTFGCQMNQYDSARMSALLEGCGYQETQRAEDADLLLVNTCSVREKPEQKAYSTLGRFQRLKERNPSVIIGMVGCVAQQEGQRLFDRFPLLDCVIGPGKIHLLLEVLEAVENRRGRLCETGFGTGPSSGLYIPAYRQVSAYVTIMEGCNNFCSYCIVPYVRGRERSRGSGEILAEIEALVQRGTREVVLLGQNVNSYGDNGTSELTFPGLLAKIGHVQGLKRIRFTTSHPKDLSNDLIEAFVHIEQLCEHIHLPVQAGSNAVLERMNRRYTREEYLAKVTKLRKAVPEISISTDVMVGFPGESEQDFLKTLDLMREVEFDSTFSFKYGSRKGTAASQWNDDVPMEEKQERLTRLLQLQREITLKRNRALEGRVVEVLVEGQSQSSPNELMGRTRQNRIVNFPGTFALVGRLVNLWIAKGLPNSLRGEIWPEGGQGHA